MQIWGATLGHVISEGGVAVDPSKVEGVVNWERPKSASDVRSLWIWQAIIGGSLWDSLSWHYHWQDLQKRKFPTNRIFRSWRS